MRFQLLDHIVELQPGRSITAVKRLRAEEEYLLDHFPRFPVMPGVLMLEAMHQAAGWLIYATDDFSHAAILLEEAKNVNFRGFVEPGQVLRVEAEIASRDGDRTVVKAAGSVEGDEVVKAKLHLRSARLADHWPDAASDAFVKKVLRDALAGLLAPTERPASAPSLTGV